MTATAEQLKNKIADLHPEIGRYGLELSVAFDKEKNAWYVKVAKGDDAMATHIEAKDADQCLEGNQCVYLGVQIGQFIKNYCEGSDACGLDKMCH